MKERILFVDDDVAILSAFRRMLRGERDKLDMTFISSSQEALLIARDTHFDVIVSDMRMPGMGGADLLAEMKRTCPKSVRVVLSGQADIDMIVKSAVSAHQYLSKPCSLEQIRKVISTASKLRNLAVSDDTKIALSQLKALHCQPELLQRLKLEFAEKHPSPPTIKQIITSDLGLSLEVLKLVNSGFFSARRTVSSVSEATDIVGLDVLRQVVTTTDCFGQPEVSSRAAAFLQKLNTHSLRIAAICKSLAISENINSTLWEVYATAGLLHDIGRLALFTIDPEKYSALDANRKVEDADLLASERNQFGCSHEEVGEYLLGLWGLPATLADASGHHHTAENNSDEISVRSAVHFVELLMNDATR